MESEVLRNKIAVANNRVFYAPEQLKGKLLLDLANVLADNSGAVEIFNDMQTEEHREVKDGK